MAAQVLTFRAGTLGELEAELIRLRDGGVNTLILRVFQNPGDRYYAFARPQARTGVYYKTDHAPVVADVLGMVLPIAHRQDMKVFAWMTTKYADYGLENRTDLKCMGYDFATGLVAPTKGLTIFSDEAAERIVGLYRDLGKYDVDGVLVQDDLVLRHHEDLSEAAQARFLSETGRELKPERLYEGVYRAGEGGKYYVRKYTPLFWDWVAWKNEHILSLANRLMGAVHEGNPRARFAINFMYESATSPRNSLAWLSQSIPNSLRYDFDLFSVMAYHRQMQRELHLSLPEITELLGQMSERLYRMVEDPRRILIKIQVRDWKTLEHIPHEELSRVFGAIRHKEEINLAIVPVSEDVDLSGLEGMW